MFTDPHRVKELFVAALDLPDRPARATFLDRECASDPDLRRRVDALLVAHEQPESALERPLGGEAATGAFEPRTESVGAVVGPYKLLQKIGEGGFGVVYMAGQEKPVRRMVALKIIKPGMDTSLVIARFESERQALAIMDHPNIAKVFDAGATESGRPYFVMELVKGVPVTEFCDKNHMPAGQRLKLFVDVCHAVQHAHQKGIIHRDIKPSNVLVTLHDGVPVVKVIDFGVAKATVQKLTERTLFTAFGQMIGTPAYMSPEQAEMSGLDIDTRSDIYSLGVLLYELLTGTTPLESKRLRRAGYAEMQRLICEEEAPRPSTRLSSLGDSATVMADNRGTDPRRLARLLAGELDWIVMKALEKDRNRRYESASNFAKDVERYLAGDAVEACPPTVGYRLKKAYRRNRAAVLVTTAFALLLTVGAVTATVLAVEAKRAERDADARRREADDNARIAQENGDRAARETARVLAAQEEQKTNQYLWDMQTVPVPFEAGNMAEVRRLLDRHATSDRRGFEWHFWDRQLNNEVHSEPLSGTEPRYGNYPWASEDSRRIAWFTSPNRDAGVESPTLFVWDTAARRTVLRYPFPLKIPVAQPGQMFRSYEQFFSPDGRRVAVALSQAVRPGLTPDGKAQQLFQVIDVATGKPLLTFPRVYSRFLWGSGTFSRDGNRFASEDLLPPGPDAPPPPPASGPTGPPGTPVIKVWDLETGKELGAPLEAKRIVNAVLHPDGDKLAIVRKRDGGNGFHLAMRDVKSGRESPGWDVPDMGVIGNLSFSPDGGRLTGAVAPDVQTESGRIEPQKGPAVVKIWDVNGGKELVSWTPPDPELRPRINRQFFSRDGSKLVVQWSEQIGGGGTQVRILDSRTGVPFPSPKGLPVTSAIHKLQLSPDGNQLLAGDNILRIWDTASGRLLRTLRGRVTPVVVAGFHPDGTRLWSVDQDQLFKEWDLAEKEPVAIPVPGRALQQGLWATLATSPEGNRIAVVDAVGDELFGVRVYDRGGKVVKAHTPPAQDHGTKDFWPIRGLALNRDARRVLLLRGESQQYSFSTNDPKAPKFGQAVKIDPPRALDLVVWDGETGGVRLLAPLAGSNLPEVCRYGFRFVSLSSDGRTAAVAVAPARPGGPARLRVFDVEAGRERSPLDLPDGVNEIVTLSLSPDGTRVAVAALNHDPLKFIGSGKLLVGPTDGSAPFAATDLFANARFVGGIRMFQADVDWHPDGSRFAFAYHAPVGGSDLAECDAATGRRVVTLERPAPADFSQRTSPARVAYSPDGRRIAALLNPDRGPIYKVWDAASGKELLTLPATSTNFSYAHPVVQLRFADGGNRLLACECQKINEAAPDRPGGEADRRAVIVLKEWDGTPRAEPNKP